MVSVVTFLSLSLLLTAGLYASYTDIRFRRIENRWTFVLIGAGVLSQIVFGVLGYTSPTRILILFGIALAMAFFLYFFGLWSPGDAKLFWGISLLLPPPLVYGQVGGLPTEYPPVALLINAFVPYFVLFLAITLVRGAWHRRGKEGTSPPSFKGVVDVLYRLTAFVGLMFALIEVLPFHLGFFYQFLLILSGFYLLERLVPRSYQRAFLLPFLLVAGYFVWGNAMGFARMGALVLVGYGVPKAFTLRLGGGAFVQEIPIRDLRVGVVPAEGIVKERSGHYRKVELGRGKYGQAKPLFGGSSRGLTERQAAELKRLDAAGYFARFGGGLKVEQTMAFAPMLLLGTLLTLWFGGTFAVALVPLVRGMW